MNELESLRRRVRELEAAEQERRKAVEALAFERAQLLSLFDSIKEVVYVSDPATYEVLYVNNHFRALLDRDPVGRPCYREFQNRDEPCDFCNNPVLLDAPGTPQRWEHHNPLLNRHYLTVDRIIQWPDGRDVRFELAIDITDRKRAEQEHEESEKRLHDILESVPAGIVVIDAETHALVEANPAACALLGAPRPEIIGGTCNTWICRCAAEACPALGAERNTPHTEGLLERKDGTRVSILKTVTPISLNGRPHLLASFIDITGQKRSAEEIAAKARELGEAKRRMEVLLSDSTGREKRLVELKQEVNDLLAERGREPRYHAPAQVRGMKNERASRP